MLYQDFAKSTSYCDQSSPWDYTVGLQKNAMIKGSIIEGEGDFGATFGLKQASLHGIVYFLSSWWAA